MHSAFLEQPFLASVLFVTYFQTKCAASLSSGSSRFALSKIKYKPAADSRIQRQYIKKTKILMVCLSALYPVPTALYRFLT